MLSQSRSATTHPRSPHQKHCICSYAHYGRELLRRKSSQLVRSLPQLPLTDNLDDSNRSRPPDECFHNLKANWSTADHRTGQSGFLQLGQLISAAALQDVWQQQIVPACQHRWSFLHDVIHSNMHGEAEEQATAQQQRQHQQQQQQEAWPHTFLHQLDCLLGELQQVPESDVLQHGFFQDVDCMAVQW